MTSRHLIILLLFLYKVVISQDPTRFWPGWTSGHSTFDVHGGVYFPDVKNLNDNMTAQNYSKFPTTFQTIGVSYKTHMRTNFPAKHDCHLTYQYIIPNNINADTVKFSLRGFNLGFDFGKDLFYKSKVFDLLVCVGFKTGRFKMLRQDKEFDNEKLYYTNPFFAPELLLEPKVILSRVSISLKAEYLFDVSKKSWQHAHKRLPYIPNSNFSGLLLQMTIGYVLKVGRQKW